MGLLSIMIDFVEENWNAFLMRCEESDLSESEVEKYIKELRELNS